MDWVTLKIFAAEGGEKNGLFCSYFHPPCVFEGMSSGDGGDRPPEQAGSGSEIFEVTSSDEAPEINRNHLL